MPLSKNDLRDFSSLHRKSKRHELGLFVVEGKKNCMELVNGNFEVVCMCTTDPNNSDFVDETELVEILRPITNSDSIWKSHSLFLLAEFFYFKENKAESKKLLNEIINYENSNSEIKLEAQKKLVRDFSE